MSDHDAPFILVSWASPFAKALLEICVTRRKELSAGVLSKAGGIATRLQLACPYIESLPRYWIEQDLEELCLVMLKQLVQICMYPKKPHFSRGFVVQQSSSYLGPITIREMCESIYKYFSDNPGAGVDTFLDDCCSLHTKLAPTSEEETAGIPQHSNIAQYDHSRHNQALFETLQKHCQCLPNRHSVPKGDYTSSWHPTRLCLEGNSPDASFGIVISSTFDMSAWQEFRLSVSADDSDDLTAAEALSLGHFCSLLEEQLFARILFGFRPGLGLYQMPLSDMPQHVHAAGHGEPLASVLRQYRLTPRDRVLLAYSVARAYWQFYDSDMMRTKWSSQTIWFMPTADIDDQNMDRANSRLPLQAFVGFPFHTSDQTPEDYVSDLAIPLHHRCPRIFALGILLLEIGLARPFLTRPFKNLTSQTNFDHKTAMSQLEILRKERWSGFSHMRYFIEAVEYCINGKNFSQESSKASRRADKKKSASSKKEDLNVRRKNLYNNVVKPLAWLEKGFKGNSSGLTYISKIPNLPPIPISTSAPALVSQQHVMAKPTPESDSPVTAFHSSRNVSIRNWLENLKGISQDIEQKRHAHGITEPVRIAILDTGINTSMPFYMDEDLGDNRKMQIESYRDFVSPEDSGCSTDQFGHGSLMARLIAQATPFESHPFAKIIVARVAKNTKLLPQCQDNVAEAIQWAGEQGADIISMSFGFPKDHQGINKAIQAVAGRQGGAVFLASAGNSPYEEETFPARHPDVISIYATNPYGKFIESNSRRPRDGSAIFGTFGDTIPPDISSEFETEYRGVCQPGSSVSTAVAAAVAAITMAYVAVLPKLLSSKPNQETLRALKQQGHSEEIITMLLKDLSLSTSEETLRALKRVRSSRGMAAVLRVMSQDMSDGQLFINLAQFWRSKGKDEAIYHELCARLWDVDRSL